MGQVWSDVLSVESEQSVFKVALCPPMSLHSYDTASHATHSMCVVCKCFFFLCVC